MLFGFTYFQFYLLFCSAVYLVYGGFTLATPHICIIESKVQLPISQHLKGFFFNFFSFSNLVPFVLSFVPVVNLYLVTVVFRRGNSIIEEGIESLSAIYGDKSLKR